MAEETARGGRFERLAFSTSLTTRILAVNLIPLMLLAGSLFFLDSYRRQLLDERFKLARIERRSPPRRSPGRAARGRRRC
jgi:two-component system sensor histidine kinase ChvG